MRLFNGSTTSGGSIMLFLLRPARASLRPRQRAQGSRIAIRVLRLSLLILLSMTIKRMAIRTGKDSIIPPLSDLSCAKESEMRETERHTASIALSGHRRLTVRTCCLIPTISLLLFPLAAKRVSLTGLKNSKTCASSWCRRPLC